MTTTTPGLATAAKRFFAPDLGAADFAKEFRALTPADKDNLSAGLLGDTPSLTY